MAASLRAGAARRTITPPRGIYQIGYGDRSKGNEGVHDELTATALVLDDGRQRLAVVACDLLAINEFTAAQVQAQLSLPVILSCSHTHAGPIVYADHKSPRRDRAWVETLVSRLVAVVNAAEAALEPVDLKWTRGQADIAVNRREEKPGGQIEIGRNPAGPVDRSVNILQVIAQGQPLATLVNFACHGTVLGPKNLLISADWPGVMRQSVEHEIGGLCLFIQGATGDMNPDYDTTGDDWDAVQELGEQVGMQVLDALSNLQPLEGLPLAFAQTQVWLPLEAAAKTPTPPPVYRRVLARTARVPAFLVDMILNRRYPWRTVVEARQGVWSTPMLVQAARIGELAYVAYGMEVFTEIGMEVKKCSPAQNTIFASLTSACTGYLPTAAEHARGGYEVDLAPYFYRLPGRLDSQAAEMAIRETEMILQSLWSDKS